MYLGDPESRVPTEISWGKPTKMINTLENHGFCRNFTMLSTQHIVAGPPYLFQFTEKLL